MTRTERVAMQYGATTLDEVLRMVNECPFRHYVTHDLKADKVYYEDCVSASKTLTVYSGVHIHIATREFNRGEACYLAFDQTASKGVINRYLVSGKTLE